MERLKIEIHKKKLITKLQYCHKLIDLISGNAERPDR